MAITISKTTLLTAAILLGCGRSSNLTFEARVSDLRRPHNSLALDRRADDVVQVKFPGQFFNPPVPLSVIRRADADWSTPERAAASIVSANIAGDPDWAAGNFVSDEQTAIRRQLADPAFAQGTFNTFRNLGKALIAARCEKNGFTVMFLRGMDEDGDSSLMTIVLARTPTGWKQTNALVNDDAFDVVWTAFQTGGIH